MEQLIIEVVLLLSFGYANFTLCSLLHIFSLALVNNLIRFLVSFRLQVPVANERYSTLKLICQKLVITLIDCDDESFQGRSKTLANLLDEWASPDDEDSVAESAEMLDENDFEHESGNICR